MAVCTDWIPTAPGVIKQGTPATGPVVCPSGWTEDFDRAQMSTRVLIGRGSPSEIPELTFNYPASGSVPPAAGTITFNASQSGSSRLYISKTQLGGADAAIWLDYLHARPATCSIQVTGPGIPTTDEPAPDPRTRNYNVNAAPVEHPTYYEVPIFWTAGTTAFGNGTVTMKLSVPSELPFAYEDAFGTAHYGYMVHRRTDLINNSRQLFGTLADRILEVRGSNSVPRLESVTIDARTDRKNPMLNMNLMAGASPEKPSRYLCRLEVEGRFIFDRMCFATGIRHHIAPDEWTLRVTLDIAEWAGQL